METFKERLIQEKAELDEKIDKLSAFINGDNFVKIEAVQQSLLSVQLRAMQTYSLILVERIAWLDRN